MIVEFMRQDEAKDMLPVEAAVRDARDRLRPILITIFAFIVGSVPLLFATGPRAELRQAVGAAVFFAMTGLTGLTGLTGFRLIFSKFLSGLPRHR